MIATSFLHFAYEDFNSDCIEWDKVDFLVKPKGTLSKLAVEYGNALVATTDEESSRQDKNQGVQLN